MKKNLKRIAANFIYGFLLLTAYALFAQTTNTAPNPAADAAAGIASGVIAALTAKYGWLLAVVSWIGVLRAVFKPLMLLVEATVKATPGLADDEAIAKFESGPIYKWLVWGLDWLASVKVTKNTNPLP